MESISKPTTVSHEEDNQPRTILVVDDMPEIRALLCDTLSTFGFRMLESSDGRQAMHALSCQKVDLMLLDIVMPEQEGLQTLMLAKQMYPNLKVIAISGYNDYLYIAAHMGVDGIVSKPFRIDQLLANIAEVFASRRV